jgi:hypothetical protein
VSKFLDAALDAIDEALCDDCDPNAPHGSNTEQEMDVDDNDPTP